MADNANITRRSVIKALPALPMAVTVLSHVEAAVASETKALVEIRELSKRIKGLLQQLPKGHFDQITITKSIVMQSYEEDQPGRLHPWAQHAFRSSEDTNAQLDVLADQVFEAATLIDPSITGCSGFYDFPNGDERSVRRLGGLYFDRKGHAPFKR